MRKLLFAVTLLGFGCIYVSCSKDSSDIKEVDDVCTVMEDINFMRYCYDNFDVNKDGKVSMTEAQAVKTINVEGKGITTLKGIEYFSALEKLSCENNHLTSLDISKNKALLHLVCRYNPLTSLKLNSKLETLACRGCQLTELNLSKTKQLYSISCSYNNLSSIDLSNTLWHYPDSYTLSNIHGDFEQTDYASITVYLNEEQAWWGGSTTYEVGYNVTFEIK